MLDVLLAEDNSVNQKLAIKMLEGFGHKHELAQNGQIAVDMFKKRQSEQKPYDIILMDVSMPIMVRARSTSLLYPVPLMEFARVTGWHGSHATHSVLRAGDEPYPHPECVASLLSLLLQLTSFTCSLVVALTAHAMIGDREKCLEAGMVGRLSSFTSVSVTTDMVCCFQQDEYVTKPLKKDSLLGVIAKVLKLFEDEKLGASSATSWHELLEKS